MAEYRLKLDTYEKEYDIWEEKHAKCVAAFNIILEEDSKQHIKGYKNDKLAFEKLKKQYGTIDLTIIDMTLQKICRINMTDKGSVNDYAEHLKKNYNEILSAGQQISD